MGLYGDLLQLNNEPQPTPPSEEQATPSPANETSSETNAPKKKRQIKRGTMTPRHRGITQPRNHATVVSRYHATMMEGIRSAVKLFGKEAATHRFTAEEKKALAGLVYTYKSQGIRTSENEITRVGVNFILADYEANGENSVLNRVLKALNS